MRALPFLEQLGAKTLQVLRGFGHAAFFTWDLILALPAALRRFGLVVAQIHAVGNLSLLIILASGTAVGFVLALQMYYALVTYGATECGPRISTARLSPGQTPSAGLVGQPINGVRTVNNSNSKHPTE